MGMDGRPHGEERNADTVLVGTPRGTRQLGRPRHRWEDNIVTYPGNATSN
jgi:hypothetical protein